MTEFPKIADLYFTTSGSIISALIRGRTWGLWSHVQVIVTTEPEINVVTADAEGVICREVREEEKGTYAILTYPEMSEGERRYVADFCFHQIGKAYDLMGLGSFLFYKELEDPARWFCSELAYCAYKAAGIRLQRRVKQDFVSPRDLYLSPLLKPIEWKGVNLP